MGNTTMIEAKRNPRDEFYTQFEDINRELNNYREQLRGLHVFMNCDDPEESNFWRYFYLNFDFLELKQITSTHYHDSELTYRLDYDGEKTTKTPLEQNGDFRSPEAIEILKEADIVVTNPPFSLFREYLAQLIEYNKNFIIMGNNNAITYKEVFPLLKEKKVWLGYDANKTMEFELPDEYEKWDRIDEKTGKKYGKVPAISWYTNMDTSKRHEDIILYETYSEEKFPSYDNYDAINVDRVAQIPQDYEGVMGVPITFLTRHNPNQFDIIGIACGNSWANYKSTLKKLNFNPKIRYGGGLGTGIVNGVAKYARILIRKSDD